MKCRKNLRVLFAEYNSASATDKPNTALMKLKQAILALKNAATHPSLLIARADVQAAIAMDISMGMLPNGATLASRYDDFVWVHHQVMMQGPNDPNGPNFAHRGPAFTAWHRKLLQLYEQELGAAVGDPNLTLPYWDWTKDQSAADPGFPFTTDFLGGDGAGNPSDKVTSGDFSQGAGWTLNLDEEGFGFLRRHFGGDGPGLPTAQSVKNALALTTADLSPWNINSAATSFRNTLEGWVGSRQIHNAVHRWVDGSMQPGTSPNDPVFFLHHCNVDRLWAVWSQKNPAVAHYLPDNTTGSASGLTRLNDKMATFGRTATDKYFGIDVTPADVIDSKTITWYDSDLPELTNETGPTLSFVDIPVGLTSFKAVKFKIKGCRPVQFRITGQPTGAFGLTSMGVDFTATPDDSADFFYGYVWVQLAAVAGPIANSSVDIHAYILDQEGYYAATEGGEYPLGDFHVGLTATTVARANNSVALVLDRSGSMADPAGGSSTKSTLLKNAVNVFNTLMLPDDEIALVSFDDQIAALVGMQQVSTANVAGAVAGTGLDPRGATWIGGGVLEGVNQLGSATHTNKSMLVLTDGNENVHPYVAELPAGTITNRTYAIGFGLPGDVSDAVLHQITSNTHGDLIITGNIPTAEQGFNLTKYFVQVLAGVTNMNVVLDPQGKLFFGSQHVIPFDVVRGDVYVDVIALCPLPQLIVFTLQTPSGKIIKPAPVQPNVQFIKGQQVLCYRVVLPALPKDPGGSHAGRWHAILSLRQKEDVPKLLRSREVRAALEAQAAAGNNWLPYRLIVHAFSNLKFEASLHLESHKPGAVATVTAALLEYDVPFSGTASVWADVVTPTGATMTVSLKPDAQLAGSYSGSFTTVAAGIYECRVRAEGYSSTGQRFTREKRVTVGVYYQEVGTVPPGSWTSDICKLLQCLVSEKVLTERAAEKLRESGVDLQALRECLRARCQSSSGPGERIPGVPTMPTSKKSSKRAAAEPRLEIGTESPAKPIKPAKAEPAPAPPHAAAMSGAAGTWPRVIRMFTRPEELEAQMHAHDEPVAKMAKKTRRRRRSR